jgi:hypothetical protein
MNPEKPFLVVRPNPLDEKIVGLLDKLAPIHLPRAVRFIVTVPVSTPTNPTALSIAVAIVVDKLQNDFPAATVEVEEVD